MHRRSRRAEAFLPLGCRGEGFAGGTIEYEYGCTMAYGYTRRPYDRTIEYEYTSTALHSIVRPVLLYWAPFRPLHQGG
jgi:hypothetical protein